MSSLTLRARFCGSLLGLALGDAVGARREGGVLERLLWRCITLRQPFVLRWTDDTQMSLDLAESLVARGAVEPDELARRFAQSYRWSRGYGPGAARVLKRIRQGTDWSQASRSIYPGGSYGNGAAMRAPVIGLFYHARPEELSEACRAAAVITHAHPLAIEGARLIATATSAAMGTKDPRAIVTRAAQGCGEPPLVHRLTVATQWLEAGALATPQKVRKRLGNGIAAVDSCVTALYISVRHLREPFDAMIRFVAACGGDVDTIGAMAGGIWGASNGDAALPANQLNCLEQRERIVATATALYECSLSTARPADG